MDPFSSDPSYVNVESSVFTVFLESLFDGLLCVVVKFLDSGHLYQRTVLLCDSSPDGRDESVPLSTRNHFRMTRFGSF